MRRTLVILAVLTAATTALLSAGAPLGEDARGHDSDCHATQACPSDDNAYVWYDGSGQGWDCGLARSGGSLEGASTIVYDGLSYICSAVSPPPASTTSTATETAPTETVTETIPPPTRTTTTPTPAARPKPKTTPQPRSSGTVVPLPVVPQFYGNVKAKLTAKGYVFPVYGPSSFIDTFRGPRATTSWHHGDDIFAPLGAPVLAVADGTLFSVGWNDVGGNRFWLQDRHGNQFYYAHLSAFSPLATNGRRVRAGDVIGFVGTTGDAAGTPPHLHFEIHPLGLLHLGYDGVINPTPWLLAWKRVEDIRLSPADVRFATAAGWTSYRGAGRAPKPGAILLQLSDISTASGLERGSLVRALSSELDVEQGSVLARGSDKQETSSRRRLSPSAREVGGSAADWRKDVLAMAGPLVWDVLAHCEAGGDWSANTGNGYFGGLQFHPGTWAAYGGYTYAPSAHEATREEQIIVAGRVLDSEGWNAWPACSLKLGLR